MSENVLDLLGAMSGEFDAKAKHPVVIFMSEIPRMHMGDTMRLGLRPTVFEGSETWSKARALYGGAGKIWERHRHRYEVNPAYVDRLQQSGLYFVGKDGKEEHMQVLELKSSCIVSCLIFSFTLNTLAYAQTTPTFPVCKLTQNSACAL